MRTNAPPPLLDAAQACSKVSAYDGSLPCRNSHARPAAANQGWRGKSCYQCCLVSVGPGCTTRRASISVWSAKSKVANDSSIDLAAGREIDALAITPAFVFLRCRASGSQKCFVTNRGGSMVGSLLVDPQMADAPWQRNLVPLSQTRQTTHSRRARPLAEDHPPSRGQAVPTEPSVPMHHDVRLSIDKGIVSCAFR